MSYNPDFKNPSPHFLTNTLIKNIVPEYKIKVRHYSNFLDETVLYAWVD